MNKCRINKNWSSSLRERPASILNSTHCVGMTFQSLELDDENQQDEGRKLGHHDERRKRRTTIRGLTQMIMNHIVRSGKTFVLPLALCGLWTSSAAQTASCADKRPNILFIFTDDHASHAMSCYGSRINKTPNLDRIAREGMLFKNCFCTNSICGPSRAVILTGKHSHINGFLQNGNTFDGSQQTFPKLLQKVGYQTAMVGKWHLKSDPTGFDYWHILIGQGPYYNPLMIENGKRLEHIGYTTEVVTDIALDFLKNKRDSDKPFLRQDEGDRPARRAPSGAPLYGPPFAPRSMPCFHDGLPSKTTLS